MNLGKIGLADGGSHYKRPTFFEPSNVSLLVRHFKRDRIENLVNYVIAYDSNEVAE